MNKATLEKANELNDKISKIKKCIEYLNKDNDLKIEYEYATWNNSSDWSTLIRIDEETKEVLKKNYEQQLERLEKEFEEL